MEMSQQITNRMKWHNEVQASLQTVYGIQMISLHYDPETPIKNIYFGNSSCPQRLETTDWTLCSPQIDFRVNDFIRF